MIAKTLFACVSVLAALAAQAADIKLIASPGVRGVLNELVPRFEQASGHKVAADFAVIAVLKRRVEAGETFDIISPAPS